MLSAIVVTLVIVIMLGYAVHSGAHGPASVTSPILQRPYENRHSDATGAREDRLG